MQGESAQRGNGNLKLPGEATRPSGGPSAAKTPELPSPLQCPNPYSD